MKDDSSPEHTLDESRTPTPDYEMMPVEEMYALVAYKKSPMTVHSVSPVIYFMSFGRLHRGSTNIADKWAWTNCEEKRHWINDEEIPDPCRQKELPFSQFSSETAIPSLFLPSFLPCPLAPPTPLPPIAPTHSPPSPSQLEPNKNKTHNNKT